MSLLSGGKTYVRSKASSWTNSTTLKQSGIAVVVMWKDIRYLSVKDFSVPQTKKQVRVFLGLAGYYSRFIPDYTSITAPLTDLTRKVAPNQDLWSAKLSST